MSQARVDHLVVLAASLAQGEAWCEATLGVTPGPGGKHPLMGTHNRLAKIASSPFPDAYLEIIAIDPDADAAQRRLGRRWFDMDDPVLAAEVAGRGPRLVHMVASVPAVRRSVDALAALGIDRGDAIPASRATPSGMLEWRITVRNDGQRLFDGTLPTLIEWGSIHPARAMPESGLALQSLAVRHPQGRLLQSAYDAIGLEGVDVSQGGAAIVATLLTPKGIVQLSSEAPA